MKQTVLPRLYASSDRLRFVFSARTTQLRAAYSNVNAITKAVRLMGVGMRPIGSVAFALATQP